MDSVNAAARHKSECDQDVATVCKCSVVLVATLVAMGTRRVYLYYFVRGCRADPAGSQWVIQFLEEDLQTPIGRIRVYGSADAVRSLGERGEALATSGERFEFEKAVEVGRGALWLTLSREQYAALRA